MAGATPLGNMVVKLGLDDADFGRGVANSKKQVTYLAKEMSANMKIADMAGDKLSKLGTRFDSLSQIIKAQQRQVSELKKSYDESFVDGKATDSTKRLAAQLQDANGKLAGYQGQLQNTAGQLARYKVETEGLTGSLNAFGDNAIANGKKLTAIGDGASKIGGALTKSVTVPLVAVGAAAVKAAIDYESAFAGVKKTVDEQVDANGKVIISYDDLSNGIRAMAKEIPASASEIAAVAEVAGQLGIKTKDVLSFSKTMIDLGESTNLSATDAATAIAKIANITGMTSDEYRRFGSSVTALGNNFATTESDIVMMTNRLASAGTLAGLTNQEILGLSTAMSSVGIEAEAGGTAMTQTLTAIEKAAVLGASAVGDLEQRANAVGLSYRDVAVSVLKGGSALKKTAAQMGMSNTELRRTYEDAGKASESLKQFADIAGMSSEQFALSWKKKPIEAIQAFIKGLGQLGDKGESATLVLDEMGLKGIRQGNMLKSLALASDTLTSAVDTSTKAWNDNTALTDEANKRYETTESKLKMLKNEVTDVAIEFGGPLVDALRDGVQAAKPVIQFLGDMAKKFSSLDKEQQQNIIKWGLMVASAGPALKIFGSITSVVGGTATNIGKLSKNLVGLAAKAAEKKAVASMAAEITTLGASAASTSGTSKIGALKLAIGGLSSPIGLAVGATAGLTAGLVMYNNAQDKAREKTEKWGVDLSKTTDNELSNFKTNLDKTKKSIDDFDNGAGSVGNVTQAFKDLNESVKETASNADKKLEETAKRLGLSDDQVAKAKAANAQYVQNADEMVNQVLEIYQRHNSNMSTLTSQEKEIIKNNQEQIAQTELDLLKLSGEEKISVQKALNGRVNELNKTQLKEVTNNLEKILSNQRSSYKEEKYDLKTALDSKMITREEYNAKMAVAEDKHKAIMEKYGADYVEAMNAYDRKLQSSGIDKTATGIWQKTRDTLNKYGDGLYDKVIEGSLKAGDTVNRTSGMVAKYTSDMTKEGKSASDQWNALVFDPKTGELKQNVSEEVANAISSEDGWNQMKFILKEANIDSNARFTIGEALAASGQWEKLSIEEKDLVVKNNEGMRAIFDSKDNLTTWNKIPDQVKNLLANNNDFMTKQSVAVNAMRRWEEMTPKEQMLTAQNMTGLPTSQAQATINSLLGKDVILGSINKTIFGKTDAQNTVDSLTGKTVGLFSSNMANAGKESAQNTVNTFGGRTVDLKANNLTKTGVDDAFGEMNRLPSEKNIVLNFLSGGITKNATGTNFHTGGDMIVNDQKGGLYKEIVQFPGQQPFIPLGRNVYIPDAPIGTKVYRASRTKSIMQRAGIPRYANGVGIPEDSKLIKNLRSIGDTQVKSDIKFNIDNSKVESRLDVMIRLFEELIEKDIIVTLDGEPVSKKLEQMIVRRNSN